MSIWKRRRARGAWRRPGARGRGDGGAREGSLPADVLDRLLEGCQVIGFDWRYLYVNDLLARQARRSREELVGRTMMACYPGIEGTPMFERLRRSMRDRTVEQMENEFTYPDGARVAFELRFVPVPQGVCVLSLDITERRHRLAAIVEDSDDAIIGRTRDGVVTSWNRSAERIFGYTAEEMLGRDLGRLCPPDALDVEAAIAARLLCGERVAHFETARVTRDGRPIDVSVTLSPVRDAAGEVIGVSTIARDISELKRTQRSLVLAREEAEAAARELETFSYSVAHDLRAPLRSVDGFSQAVLEDCGDRIGDVGRGHLGRVRDAARRMGQLIDDLLSLSRVTRSELRRERVDLSAMARASLAQLRRLAPERAVDAVVAEGAVARGDPRLLAVVVDNLLGNAWKFTARRPRARIEFGVRRGDEGAEYFVRDDGAGFDMAYVKKLFQPFQRLHSAHEFEGTGVGLAIVQRVVARHEGRAWAEGATGEGATFSFTLGPQRE